MSKHTPGPWTCLNRRGGVSQYIEGNGVTVARVGEYDSGDAWSADARLIAAAPELLEAARKLIGSLADQGGEKVPGELELETAIVKATGEGQR